MKQRAPLPKAIVHDGLSSYVEAFQKELFAAHNPQNKNIRSIGLNEKGLNPILERLNGTVRDRETVMRGLDNAEAAQDLIDAMRIHYNFIRPHQVIGNQTPAEAADFYKVTFSEQAYFSRVTFSNEVYFSGTRFLAEAFFVNSTFTGKIFFRFSIFEQPNKVTIFLCICILLEYLQPESRY
jgi:Integrase core domain